MEENFEKGTPRRGIARDREKHPEKLFAVLEQRKGGEERGREGHEVEEADGEEPGEGDGHHCAHFVEG